MRTIYIRYQEHSSKYRVVTQSKLKNILVLPIKSPHLYIYSRRKCLFPVTIVNKGIFTQI